MPLAPGVLPEADLHCHLLPDWDDGPQTLEKSLEMARTASAAGLKKILVTPHVGRFVGNIKGHVERPAQDIPHATAQLEEQIRAAGIDLSLVPGAELTFSHSDLAQKIVAEPWLTVGGQGRYILIESTFGCWPRYANQLLYQISLAGATAMIAHPERLPDVQRDIRILEEAVNRGALLQITARSLLGEDDRRRKKCSYELLEAGMVGIVASDAHSSKSVWPHDVQAIVQSIVGEKKAQHILVDNPEAVLTGQPIRYAPTVAPAKKTSFWSKMLAGR